MHYKEKSSKKRTVLIAVLILILAALGLGGFKAKQYYDNYRANSAEIWANKGFAEAAGLTGCELYISDIQNLGEDTNLFILNDGPDGSGNDRVSFVVRPARTDRFGLKYYEYAEITPLLSKSLLASEALDVLVSARPAQGAAEAYIEAPAKISAKEPPAELSDSLSGFDGKILYYEAEGLFTEGQLAVKDSAGNDAEVSEYLGLPLYRAAGTAAAAEENADAVKAFRASMSEKLVRFLDTENKEVTSLKITEPFYLDAENALIGLEAGLDSKDEGEEVLSRIYSLSKKEDGSISADSELTPEDASFAALLPALGAPTDEEIFVIPHSEKFPYYIRVNRLMNTVTVYGPDADGNYTVPVKAMICSTGREGHETPLGDFEIMNFKARWCYMVDGSYGQYATGFRSGGYLFHSICYESKSNDSMMADEYNLLGDFASLGCVRLQTVDAKWIFDNCPVGTGVTIYEDENPGPLGKPAKLISEITPDMDNGWDPTDPLPENPWRQ